MAKKATRSTGGNRGTKIKRSTSAKKRKPTYQNSNPNAANPF